MATFRNLDIRAEFTPPLPAWIHRRSAGYIANIRYETTGTNSTHPAYALVVLKLLWANPTTGGFLCIRLNRRPRGRFRPGVISPISFAHIRLGDLFAGVIETPRAEQRSTCMVPRGSPDLSLFAQIRGPQVPRLFEIILEPKIAADLPQLGGGEFSAAPDLIRSRLVTSRVTACGNQSIQA